MQELLEAPEKLVVARQAFRSPGRPAGQAAVATRPLDRGAPMLNPAQFVPADVHQTSPEIIKKDLPQRIRQLIELQGSPLLVNDRQKLIQEFQHFRRLLPRVRLFYAVKANPHPDIVLVI